MWVTERRPNAVSKTPAQVPNREEVASSVNAASSDPPAQSARRMTVVPLGGLPGRGSTEMWKTVQRALESDQMTARLCVIVLCFALSALIGSLSLFFVYSSLAR